MAENSEEKARPTRPDLQFDPRAVNARNVSGSTAGSGSGDFHVYRQERLRELTRIQKLEEAEKRRQEEDKNNGEFQARRDKALSRTQTKAAKRKRRKERAAAVVAELKKSGLQNANKVPQDAEADGRQDTVEEKLISSKGQDEEQQNDNDSHSDLKS